MPKREIEGDWVMGWPDRKRPTITAGKDAQGRVINGRAPITELEGLITPTDAYYVVNQLDVPEPIHPDDWMLAIGGEVEHPIEISRKDLQKLPGRTVRAVTECAGNDAGFFDCLTKNGRKPSRINQQDMQERAAMREQNAVPSTEEISSESTTTCAMSAGEFTGVPLAEVLERVLDDGTEIVEASLPALVTVSNELGAARTPSLRETMRAARKPIVAWSAADLGLRAGDVGSAGIRCVRERVFVPVHDNRCEMVEGASPEEQAAKLARRLREAKAI